MNAIEIEEAISQLAEKEFSRENFPFEFLESFGDKATTIKRLRSGSTNSSDLKDQGGVLKRNNIHILVCDEGEVAQALQTLKASSATTKAKANFVLATDGLYLEAADLNSGETVACEFEDFPNHFGFFLPLAGISTVKQIRNNPIDIQATGRLNRLYNNQAVQRIIKQARCGWHTGDKRPLYLLGWGNATDIAQAIFQAPDIIPVVRLVTQSRGNNGRFESLGSQVVDNYNASTPERCDTPIMSTLQNEPVAWFKLGDTWTVMYTHNTANLRTTHYQIVR